jgi:glycosyltransferase involved in cell wall biosynthesis
MEKVTSDHPSPHIGISTSVIQRGKSGVGQYVFALLRAMLEKSTDQRFTLFVLAEDVPLFEFARGKVSFVTVSERFRPATRNIAWHQTHLPRLAKQLGLDVLHIPSYRRLLWRRPCATVGTIHDLAPFHVTGKYDWKRMFYGRVIVRRLAQRQHRIIAISQNTARDIQKFFAIPKNKLSVIHNGLDHGRFRPMPKEEAKRNVFTRHGLQKPFFLYVSRIEHPAKNHVRLIHAFEKFKETTRSEWQLVFGGSDWHGAENVHAAIKQSRFASDIRTLGFVPDEELPVLYGAASVFVYPSLFEGFGLPPVEAMACGCPVISSTRGSLAEVVGDGAAIVDPDDLQSMTAQLTALATDKALREMLIRRGLQQAAKFDWNLTAEKTLRVYEQVMIATSRGKD